ncbi:MAG: hypothetical protein V1709_11805 [Planctomycetota bacterium]
MPDKDYISRTAPSGQVPKDNLDFDSRLHNFLTKLAADPTAYGISPDDMAELKVRCKEWNC